MDTIEIIGTLSGGGEVTGTLSTAGAVAGFMVEQLDDNAIVGTAFVGFATLTE